MALAHKNTARDVAHRLYPVRIRIDMLTAIYHLWSYRRLHRAVTALDAMFHAPLPQPPSHALPSHEYGIAASLWNIQWAIDSDEARFAREMTVPLHNNARVSLRTYVRMLKDRMSTATKRGLFDDLDDPDPAIEEERERQLHALILEARACLTFAFAHDQRWRRLIMHPPGHLFDECAPDRDEAAAFVDYCIVLTSAFIDEQVTLTQVAEMASEKWMD